MTPAEIQALAAPISGDEPCGPDLETLGDADYMRFVARVESFLPQSFSAFDRASIDFPTELATLKALLGRSRDLRLMAFLAKLLILNRDLPGFLASFQTMEALLDQQWEPIHPQLLDGDAILRIVAVQMLDDLPDSVMPLQTTPLFETRRFGKVSYRSHLLASGQIQPRTNADGEVEEAPPAAGDLRTALTEADLTHLVAARDLHVALRQSYKRIETLAAEKSGQPVAVKFENLAPVADGIIAFLDEAVTARDPTLALAPGQRPAGDEGESSEARVSGSTGVIRSLADASAALAAAAGYFTRSEPSSPVLLLIGQSEALIGRNFYDAMTALLPDLSAQATVKVGRDFAFHLPLERLSSLSITVADSDDDQAEAAADETAPQDEVSWGETASEPDAADESHEESTEADAANESDAGEESDGAPADGEAAADDPSADAEPANADEQAAETADDAAADSPEKDNEPQPVRAPAHAPAVFRAINRQDAVTLLSQVATYFRAVEPSSPVPTLLDHAGGLAGRDFFTLLREMLPASALRVDE